MVIFSGSGLSANSGEPTHPPI